MRLHSRTSERADTCWRGKGLHIRGAEDPCCHLQDSHTQPGMEAQRRTSLYAWWHCWSTQRELYPCRWTSQLATHHAQRDSTHLLPPQVSTEKSRISSAPPKNLPKSKVTRPCQTGEQWGNDSPHTQLGLCRCTKHVETLLQPAPSSALTYGPRGTACSAYRSCCD